MCEVWKLLFSVIFFEVAKSTDPSSHRSVPQQTTSRDLPLKRCGSQEKRFEFEVLLRG